MSHDTDIEDMTQDVLDERGESCTYSRGGQSETITLVRQQQPTFFIDVDGIQVLMSPVDFKGLTSALPFGDPRKGDRITDSDEVVYEVQPTTDEKVFRQISDAMTRIHTKKS